MATSTGINATTSLISAISAGLLGLLLLSVSANAQELPLRTGPAASSCQFDSTAIRGTIDFTLFLTPPLSVAKARTRREQYAPYINAIASTFEQPPKLSISYWPGDWADEQIAEKVEECDAWCSAGPLEGEVQFRLHKGRLSAVSWQLAPDSREVMAALEHAIRAADSLHLFPESHKVAGLPAGTVRLALRLDRAPSMLGGVPIGKVRLPHILISRPVAIEFQPIPHFPAAAAQYGIGGVVSLQYIVGLDGMVPEESIRVLDAEDAVFIEPAVRAIVGSRFGPAEASGCPVRQLVQQRVVFHR